MRQPHNGTATSAEAARRIEPAVTGQLATILDFLRARGGDGATLQEIEEGTGIGGNSVRPRVITLRRENLVVDSQQVRATRSHRKAVVWLAAE